MSLVLDATSLVLLLGGSVVLLTGALGLLRLPDVYARTHAASLTDTLGAVLLLAGMALQATGWLVVVKLGAVALLLLITGPVATHALARAALQGGLAPRLAGRLPSSTPTQLVEPRRAQGED